VGHNIVFDAVRGEGPTLLFNSHLDTVPACSGWDRDPLAGDLEGSRLYGLGSNDAGGSVVAMISAAARLRALNERDPLPGTVRIALTVEEETGGAGISELLKELETPDAAVVGEPTGCRTVLAQKGLLVLKGVARGVAGHAAHGESNGATNAVHLAARSIASLVASPEGEAHPLLGPTTIQVTQIDGGHARNAVPDRCEFWVDVRTNPGADPEAIHRSLARRVECELLIHSSRLRAVETSGAEAIARAAVEASGHPAEGSRTTSDWVHLAHVPTVKLGPGDTSRSHRADEYLDVAELEQGTNVYTLLAKHYFALVAQRAGICR
jgi:acetylornithine deacetylase